MGPLNIKLKFIILKIKPRILKKYTMYPDTAMQFLEKSCISIKNSG